MQPSANCTRGDHPIHGPGTDPSHKKGLRTVATVEALKGLMATVAGFLVLALVHKDVWDAVESVFEFLHINPDRHFAQLLLDLADRVTDAQLWMLAAGLFAYSLLRFVEAYGLWRTRIWAEWLAILSGLVYMPFEVREILQKATLVRWGLLAINLALVGYVAWVRFAERRRKAAIRPANAAE